MGIQIIARVKYFLPVILGFVFIIPSPVFFGQARPPQDQNDIKLGINEVAVDVIAVDKKGKQIKDLSAADFVLTEDGVPQTIKSFKLVSREGSSQSTATGDRAKVTGANVATSTDGATVKYITLVFDTRIVSQDLM